MNLFGKYFLISICLIVYSCGSSSFNNRYEKAKSNTEKEKSDSGSARFTSTGDYKKLFNSEFDEKPVEDYPVDKNEVVTKYSNIASSEEKLSPEDKLIVEIIRYVNTPYLYGGSDKEGIDCSAFTRNVFYSAENLSLPRTAALQFKEGKPIADAEDLQFGDLIFFDTRKAVYPGHVGIYIGENLFAHAGVSHGVTISSLQSSYYKKRFISGKRVMNFTNKGGRKIR